MGSGTSGGFNAWNLLPKDTVDQDTPNEGGLKCELKTFESRYDWKGEKVLLSVGSKTKLGDPDHVAPNSALVLTRFYNKESEVDYTELEIRSPHLKNAFKEVVPKYKDLNTQAKSIVLHEGVRYFFYYRTRLQEYGRNLEDHTAIEHLMFALTYMYTTLESELRTYYNFVEVPYSLPSIDFINLWMVFRPGDYYYEKIGETERVTKIREMHRFKSYYGLCHWRIEGDGIDYDGKTFGVATRGAVIRPYDGYKPLIDLAAKPLSYHPDKGSIVKRMVQRGKKYTSLHGIYHRKYDGTAEALAANRRVTSDGEEDEFPLQAITIKGQIMIDGKRFFEAAPSHEPYFLSTRTIETEDGAHLSLEDDDYLICSHVIPGFSLFHKRWCLFSVDRIKDVEYNMTAFESLMLDRVYKQTILSLVKVHTSSGVPFDDVIKGKGKGLVFLLHGIPGVGKTLTAESVADFCKRPLYTISAGDIGISASSVELDMEKALRLAETWNAIILIDEADVFLEQRTTNDLVRNGLVSVFLRILEYYQGIMFLTTNRIGSFDDAFKSRIHLAVMYPALSPASRKSLWETFLRKASPGSSLAWLNPESLERISSVDLNGRQIKNIARTAAALAAGEETAIRFSHIDTALKAMQAFNSNLATDVTRTQTENVSCTCGNPLKRRRIE